MLKTASKDTLFLDAKQSKTAPASVTQSATLIIDRQAIQTALSRMPTGLRLKLVDCCIILFAYSNCALPYLSWPEEYRNNRLVEKLKKRGYLNRKYDPLRYGLTKSGFSLASWILACAEHTTTTNP